MAVNRIPLIAGNWKMNFNHLEAIAFVQKLAWTLKEVKHDDSKVETLVIPPFTDLRSVQTVVQADNLKLSYGAQDLSEHDKGAYTGDISGEFLSALECKYVLIGHSERRTIHGESDELLAKKVTAAVRHNLIPLICVGESSEDLEKYGAAAIPVKQLEAAMESLSAIDEFVVAYEPVWAIGSGVAATAEQAQNVIGQLRKTISAKFGAEVAEKTRILYGGSVKSSNIAGFMKQTDIDGALIGGASLDLDEFSSINQFQKHVSI